MFSYCPFESILENSIFHLVIYKLNGGYWRLLESIPVLSIGYL